MENEGAAHRNMIQQKTEKNVIGALHLVFVFAYQLNYKYAWCAAPFLVI